jgi:hypothetical protein
MRWLPPAQRPLTCLGACLLGCLLAGTPPAEAADTGLVHLKNGDRIAGEVKNMRLGKLELNTTSMGTIYVEWDKVVGLTAPEIFEIERTDGARFYGSLAPAGPGQLGVVLADNAENLEIPAVVRIRRLKEHFWDRLDGSISVGASFTQSSGIGQGSVDWSVTTRRPSFEFGTKFDTTITVQPDEPDETVAALSGSYTRLLRSRWRLPFTGMLERNTDLGLELRSSFSGGVGRYLVQTNRSFLGAMGGLLVNQEEPVSGEATQNVEAVLGVSYSFYTYDTPKTNLSAELVMYPSFTVSGRIRTEFDFSLRREIIADFTVGVTAYDSYDSKPPEGSSSKHDIGATLNVGWVF